MKKFIPILLLALTPFLLQAQKYSTKERAVISGRVDSLLMNYMQKSSLTEAGTRKLIKAEEFKSLFTKDANVFDDINPDLDTVAALETGKNPYILKERKLDEFVSGIFDRFDSGMIIANKRININYDNFEEDVVTAALERTIEAKTFESKTKGHYRFRNDDTLLISMSILPDKTVRIKSISKLGAASRLAVENDKDLDGVPDEKDDCPGVKGKRSLHGCPDSDDDGIPDKDDDCPTDPGPKENNGCPYTTFAYRFVFSANVGYQLTEQTLAMPDLGTLGYKNIDRQATTQVPSSNAGHVTNPGYTGSESFGANIAYYIGRNKNNRNKGISLGFSVTHYSATYDLSNVVYQYQKTDAGNDIYRRIVSMQGGQEDFTFNIINIPLLFKIKHRFGSKWAFELSAGPSFVDVLFSSSTLKNTTFNYEGIYHFNKSTGKFDYNPADSASNVLFVSSAVANKNNISDNPNGPSATVLFLSAKNAGYDIDLKKAPPQSLPLTSRSGIALNGSIDLFYHLTATLAIRGGFNIVFGYMKNKTTNGEYIMTDNTTDQYNSFYNANTTSYYSSFGLNVGIIKGL